MNPLACVTLLPLRFASGALAATLRAGGTALIDCTETTDGDALQGVLATLSAEGRIGLYLTPRQIALADRLGNHPHHLVLGDWTGEELPGLLTSLEKLGRSVWLELLQGEDLARVDSKLPFHGWLGRGSECGGRSGRESAFILCQHLARQSRPFWIQGGIGPHSAAAARAGGASGVVLDDALLLLRDFPLPARWRALLSKLSMEDTVSLGEEWGAPRRVVLRSGLGASIALRARAEEIAAALPTTERTAAWREAVDSLIGWGDPARHAWPLGQGAGRAGEMAARYGTIGRLIRAVDEISCRSLAAAADLRLLAADGPLAQAQGTRLPVVQGPMTRVSDGVPFAEAVAKTGGLPMLALSVMPGPRVRTLLDEATTALSGNSWGVGLLGYLPPELAEAQYAQVVAARPPFALIAGGRPDQAARLEAEGIATYIHVPTPSLLKLFLDQGVRRLVFEGSECGGHVGPLNSFALWEAMTEVLLDTLPAMEGETIDVLFAGGIHDARSAAMAATLAAPLAEKGVRFGVLMGSAYLFTKEAVESGAIVSAFQHQAMTCNRTALIETRPGHRVRCAPTPFVDQFETQRSELKRRGLPDTEAGDELENLLTGKLRIASKGVERTAEGLVEVDEQRSLDQGIFMMGEVAGLRDAPLTCAELHEAVTSGATALIEANAATEDQAQPNGPIGEPVAIIGIGCLLPGAQDPETLWRNLLDGTEAIREVPRERWDWRLYFDADPAARDRIYSKWGGFIDPVPFDPLAFGIPPNSLEYICMPQLVALETTRRALEDAGLGNLSHDDGLRERTAAIFGVASGGDLDLAYKTRSGIPLASRVEEDFWRRLPEWSEETYPGILLNIVAGRVANRFDLGGPNFTVDAACASSLASLDLAVRELQSGRSDLALAGAVETEMTPHVYTAFSKTRALSPQGRARVFDEAADGIVISEGAVTVVLKRLADAERDGDRIYAVIRGVAGSSDGKGMGLTAPKPAGQIKAVERAHFAGGTSVATVGLYEAHGTGTKVGDRAELETFTTALRQGGAAPGACAAGSAKSLLGHTRCAAGLTGLTKAALALRHRVLPPHRGVEKPLPSLLEQDSPLHLLDQPLPWLQQDGPRRAGISAFGFGGTNFHAVLEEHDSRGPEGADRWPAELVVLAAADRAGLSAGLDRLQKAAEGLDRGWKLRDLALTSVVEAADGGLARLALVARTVSELKSLLAAAKSKLEAGGEPPPGVFWSFEPSAGELAFLFPGQGAQRPGMGAELSLYSSELRTALERSGLRRLILPPAAYTEEARLAQEKALADTRVAQPAIAAVSCGMLDFARRLGLKPARVAGHSFGEFVALHAAGALNRDGLLRLAAARGQAMADLGPEAGTMAAVSLSLEEVKPYLAESGTVRIANINAPSQVVLSGPAAAMEKVLADLEEAGHGATPLAVSAAFHSPLVAAARQPFSEFLAEASFHAPSLPVHGNLDGQPYPAGVEEIRQRCVEHMEQQVNFVAQLESMWDAGVRSFLELGPGRVLTRLTGLILGDRPHLSVSADGGLAGWLGAMAQLWTRGHRVDLAALFDGRDTSLLNLDEIPQTAQPSWMLDGGRIHRTGKPPLLGELPLLDGDSPTGPLTAAVDPVTAAYGEYQETMRRFLEQQERVLAQMMGQGPDFPLRNSAVPEPNASPPPKQETAPSPKPVVGKAVEAALDRNTLVEQLTRLVSERTGYPLDMLRVDQDMEGELGIDSIKRIEIIGKLVKGLPSGHATNLQKQFNRLVRAKTLRTLVDTVLREATAEVVASSIGLAAAGAKEHCPRFVMSSSVKPLLRLGTGSLEGLHVVTADNGPLAELVVAGLRRHGAGAALIARTDLAEPCRLTHRLAVLREVHGPVRGVIHLGALGLPMENESLDAWHAATTLSTKSLFTLLQSCTEELADQSAPMCLVAATQMGGDWGRSKHLAGSPAGGGSHGILRSLEQEYPHILTKVVDFDASLTAEITAERIVDEVLSPGGGEEVGYQSGRRVIFSPEMAPLGAERPSNLWRPGKGSVILATGGARGITAEILHEMAGPGVRLILVGRSGGSSSPDRNANQEAFRQAGAEVEYHGVDVRSESEFGALIDDVYQRFGRIDGVIHGAGVIEDQRFAAKDSASFDRVFDTKADSTFILSRKLRQEGLKWVVLFASVAGRFGNHGQSDYAAGNETMVRLAHQMDARWPGTRVVAIAWGPWQGTGMASIGVQAQLEAQGIIPIKPEEGRQFLVDELTWGRKGETEVIAGRGPWELSFDQTLAAVFEASVMLLQMDDSDNRDESRA